MIRSRLEPPTALEPLGFPLDPFVSKGESRDALLAGLAERKIAWEADLGERFFGDPDKQFPYIPTHGRLYRPVILDPEERIITPEMNSTDHLCRVGEHEGSQRTPLEFVLHFSARYPLNILFEWGHKRIVFIADLQMPPGNPDCLALCRQEDGTWSMQTIFDYPGHEWDRLDETVFILSAIDTDKP
ncbi:MAG: hypothetical protein JWL80_314 [Parcubacteria group bacterium]|nr:hypothetical protein [Parcubacteria group bacterium]